MAIADEISSYIHRPVEKIADREQAIKAAMSVTVKELDAVIIAGKADCYQNHPRTAILEMRLS